MIEKKQLRKLWLLLAGTLVSLLLWVNQSVRSTQISYRIQEIETQIKREQRIKTDLERQINQLLSLESIEAAASKKLGLVQPGDESIVMMTVQR